MTTLTNTQIQAWLSDDSAIRGTIVEIKVTPNGSNTEITRYLSTFTYITKPTDTPANTEYLPIIIGGFRFSEKMDYKGSGNISVGDLEIMNYNGEYDSWLNDNWTNKTIKVLVGDPRWTRDKFIEVFDGIVNDIDSRSNKSLNLKIRDKLQRLNTPISEITYSDIYPYPTGYNTQNHYEPDNIYSTVPEQVMPLVFGEVHNITPVLIDPGKLTYCMHYGSIQGIIEIRDNGMMLTPATGYTVDTSTGTFKLNYNPVGTITTSLAGDNSGGYTKTVAATIKRLVTNYGKVVPDATTGRPTSRTGAPIPNSTPPMNYPVIVPSPDRFVDGTDIDTANFSAFDSANPQFIGVYVPAKQNLLATCRQLAASVGGCLTMTRLGKLRLLKLESPPVGTPRVIDQSMYKFDSLSISDRIQPVGAIKLGFCKNWTVQKDLETAVIDEHKKLFAEEWSVVSMTNAAVLDKYKLNSNPEIEQTFMILQRDANQEATRRLNLWSKPHTIYKIVGLATLLDLNLGDTVQLVSNRYGLNGTAGVGLGTVVSLQPNWNNATVDVEIFV